MYAALYIPAHLPYPDSPTYLALLDVLDGEREFVWYDGSKITFSEWADNEPAEMLMTANYEGEDCAFVLIGFNEVKNMLNLEWHMQACTYQQSTVCKKKQGKVNGEESFRFWVNLIQRTEYFSSSRYLP